MITVNQMRALERQALHQGILPLHLMENAGQKVYEVVKEKFDFLNKKIVIFAGIGNNGGDSFVAARYFVEECPVLIFLFGDVSKLSEEAQESYQRIKEKVNIIPILTKDDLQQLHFQPHHNHILIDALLGLGIKGEVKDPLAFAIDYFNALPGIKVAIDVPSGMNPDSGEGKKMCEVDLIITLHDLKPGLQKLKERTVIIDIGLSQIEISLPSQEQNGLS